MQIVLKSLLPGTHTDDCCKAEGEHSACAWKIILTACKQLNSEISWLVVPLSFPLRPGLIYIKSPPCPMTIKHRALLCSLACSGNASESGTAITTLLEMPLLTTVSNIFKNVTNLQLFAFVCSGRHFFRLFLWFFIVLHVGKTQSGHILHSSSHRRQEGGCFTCSISLALGKQLLYITK